MATEDRKHRPRSGGAGWAVARWRLGLLAGAGALVVLVHWLAPEWLALDTMLALGVGVLLGLAIGRVRGGSWLGHRSGTQRVVVQDIAALQQAFGVLRRQIGVTIESSESAVLSMMTRMNRVHANTVDLHRRVMIAVDRSRSLSSDSLDRAGRHGEAVATLADHQQAFERAQRDNLQRVHAIAEQVRALTPLADLIADISRQTNLLSINASIEAARAGPEGAGFKVVATEVRRLSSQTSDAASQIAQGIMKAAGAIDAEFSQAEHQTDDASAAEQLGEIAQHIQQMGETLADVVPYLSELAGTMDTGMAELSSDIVETLGDMQFQDINRQVLEQITAALGSLSDHFSQLYELIDGQAPPPPVLLEELMSKWTDSYVMHSQRLAHAMSLSDSSGEPAAASVSVPEPELALAGIKGPRIELF